MNLKANYLSIVTIGSFNPAILNPEFLKQQKIFDWQGMAEGTSTPVVSEIKFGNISFLTELERFQIIHHNINEFDKSPIVQAAYSYLDILKYTPIMVQGLNFNVSLIPDGDAGKIDVLLDNPIEELLNLIDDAKNFLVDLKITVKDRKQNFQLINCKFYIDSEISISINIARNNDKSLILNYNYEVEGINLDRKRISLIPENFRQIYLLFSQFIAKLER
ncbi:MAG: hypothetical protein V1816_10210 [Pseudomonadota bacterium]